MPPVCGVRWWSSQTRALNRTCSVQTQAVNACSQSNMQTYMHTRDAHTLARTLMKKLVPLTTCVEYECTVKSPESSCRKKMKEYRWVSREIKLLRAAQLCATHNTGKVTQNNTPTRHFGLLLHFSLDSRKHSLARLIRCQRTLDATQLATTQRVNDTTERRARSYQEWIVTMESVPWYERGRKWE